MANFKLSWHIGTAKEMRDKLRTAFKEKHGIEPMEDLLKYMDYLERYIMEDPHEKAIHNMVKSIESLEVHVETSRAAIESVFNKEL